MVQTGVQVLFAFLLMAPLSSRFPELSGGQQVEYFVTLLSSGAAAVLLMAPTAHHRILFRCGDKDHLVKVANRYTLVGLACVGLSMLGALLFVTGMLFPARWRWRPARAPRCSSRGAGRSRPCCAAGG